MSALAQVVDDALGASRPGVIGLRVPFGKQKEADGLGGYHGVNEEVQFSLWDDQPSENVKTIVKKRSVGEHRGQFSGTHRRQSSLKADRLAYQPGFVL